MKSFASDNYAGVLPEVMQALQEANNAHAQSYGADTLTAQVKEQIKELFGAVDVFFVFNGTGANVLSISAATQSYNAVLCADISHIYNDESSAPETITSCRFFPLQTGENGKLTPEIIATRLIRKGDVHYAQAKLLSITQATEYGTVYTPEEIKAISQLAKQHNVYLHMDGSRYFNAAASLGCDLKDISGNIGVDILSLGGTKAGMMFGEAVVVFNKELATHIAYKQKQVMQLASKTRFIAAQFGAMLHNDLWRKTASHANAMAKQMEAVLQKYPQVRITRPVNANVVFAVLPVAWTAKLQEQYPFYVWNDVTNEVRLMCSFDSTEADIQGFDAAIAAIAANV